MTFTAVDRWTCNACGVAAEVARGSGPQFWTQLAFASTPRMSLIDPRVVRWHLCPNCTSRWQFSRDPATGEVRR